MGVMDALTRAVTGANKGPTYLELGDAELARVVELLHDPAGNASEIGLRLAAVDRLYHRYELTIPCPTAHHCRPA
ncbi:hypothetical protein ABZW10_32970 [Kitasatospora sp. NPDC004723]|uniref:hypothetical protein n=1 Tax=Kitasatospora sp. NPDC004723 TaxID=3154288 RepID=UPI0033AE0977